MIQCISPCIYENEGECTLNHITSASNTEDQDCAYFRNKKDSEKEKPQNRIY